MKKYLLLLGMSLCLGVTFAQEQGHQSPKAVTENPVLMAQITKIETAKSAVAQSSRSGSQVAQQDLQAQLEIYVRLLQEEIDHANSEETKTALKEELMHVQQQFTTSQTKR